MTAVNIAERIRGNKALIERALDACLPASDTEPRQVHEAMRYAVLGEGKRLRPLLSLAVGDIAGLPPDMLLDTACAIEFAHTASLIFDDLPCMDDAQTRRGMPCVHTRFGKANAILAAIGLLMESVSLVTRNAESLRPETAAAAVRRFTDAIGTRGLVYGQYLDLTLSGASPTQAVIENEYNLKAAALFSSALLVPGTLAGLPDATLEALRIYAERVGLAFQIIDDLHDAAAPREDAGKSTLAAYIGIDAARERAHILITQALEAIEPLGSRAAALSFVAEYVRTAIG